MSCERKIAMAKTTRYDESSIDAHIGLDGVRQNPRVYISNTDDSGRLLLVKEVVQNGFDEAILPEVKNKSVLVSLDKDAVWVADCGRGIPVGIHKTTKISTLTTIMITLSAGGKMRAQKDSGYSKATSGCFTYDTKIETLSGKKIKIGKLAEQYEKTGKEFWVYSHNPKGEYIFEPAKASAFPTKVVNKLAVVRLDNGEVIRCTIDHPFLDVNGIKIQAQKLTPNTSLMSMNIKEDKDGYHVYWDKKQNCRVAVHRAVADMTGQDIEDKDVHHTKGNKKDNRPHMLQALNRWTHARTDLLRNKKLSVANTGISRDRLSEQNTEESHKNKQQNGKILRCFTRLLYNNLEINEINYNDNRIYSSRTWENISEKKVAFLTKKANKIIKQGWTYAVNSVKMPVAEYVTYNVSTKNMVFNHNSDMIAKRVRGRVLKTVSAMLANKIKYNRINYENYRKISKGAPTYDTIEKYFKPTESIVEQARAYNHKVLNVKIIDVKPTQVFGLTVNPNHNYLLSAGVFVRNTHGMGVSIVNALSSLLDVWTHRDGQWYTQSFAKGKPTTKVLKVKKPPVIPNIDKKLQFKQGTIIKFVADPSVFEKGAKLQIGDLKEFLNISSYLIPGIKIQFATEKKQLQYYQPKGLVAYLETQLEKYKTEALGKVFEYHCDSFDVAMCWSGYDEEGLSSFVNGVPTPEHGTHINGLNQAVMEALSPLKLKKHVFKAEDLRMGLIGVINVQVNQPKFTTQNKVKLATVEATEMVKKELKPQLVKFFSANKKIAKQIIEQAHQLNEVKAEFKINKKFITALKTKKKGKSLLPEKLTVAHTKDPMQKELFLVEGDSAAGTAESSRNSLYQEILALKGKPMNVFRNKPDKIAKNEPIQDIAKSIGYDPEKKNHGYRIGRVILLADADDDGDHISLLLSGVMYKMFRPLIEAGNLYVVDGSSLFTTQVGTKRYYGPSRQKLLDKLPESHRNKANVTRLKGWGEANADLLEEVAFNPLTRKLKRIVAVKGKNLQKFLSVVDSDTAFRKELLGL